MNGTTAEILEAIRSLSPGQRRQLYRRLRAVGLLNAAGPWADTNRLQVAPAVRRAPDGAVLKPSRKRQSDSASSPTSSSSEKPAAPVAETNGPHVAPEPVLRPQPVQVSSRDMQSREVEPDEDGEYRSGVRSKVVMGAPSRQESRPLEVMEPVPGQAPESPIRIIFDGGSRGNPGKGYGSYALDWPGLPQQVVQLRFGDRVTNNEAEYDTLISALEATIKKLEDSGAGPEAARLEIFGDSLLVVNQVLGEWDVKNARMRTRCDRVKYLLSQFGAWRLEHHDRENSVRVLGH